MQYTRLMSVSLKMVSLAILIAASSVQASSSASSSWHPQIWRINRPRHPPNEQLTSERRAFCGVGSRNSLIAELRLRGGDSTRGRSAMKLNKSDDRDGEDAESAVECDDCDECEYEYEYVELDEDNDEVEWDNEVADIAAIDVEDDADAEGHQLHLGDNEFEPDAEEAATEAEEVEDEVNAHDESEDNDDDGYLFTTPISQKRQSVDRAELNVPKQAEEVVVEEESDDDEAEIYLFETPIPTKKDTTRTQSTRKANRASKATTTTTSNWWWQKQNPVTNKQRRRPTTNKGRKLQSRRRHASSSRGASFIPPPFYQSSSSSRPFGIRTLQGISFYSDVLSSLSSALGVLLQPMGNSIQSIIKFISSTISRYISISLSLIHNSLDFMWYGPVEGVTTTGIPTRYGGLSVFLTSGPVLLIASSIVFVGLLSVMISSRIPNDEKRTIEQSTRENNGRRFYRSSDGDMSDDEPPSIEEELHFLNREFDAANPTTKDRITKSIISTTNRLWPKQSKRRNTTNKDTRPKSRRGQRQFTIQSIQRWWKERPNQPPIAIIEPQHIRNQQQQQQQQQQQRTSPPTTGKEIHQLQKKLAVSEQERAILEQDVQHLLTKLQRAQKLAKSASLHNKWQEKLTSRTDQILLGRENGGVVQEDENVGRQQRIPRSKGGGTIGQTRGTRIADGGGGGGGGADGRGMHDWEEVQRNGGIRGRNDLDIQAGPNPRILDGVTIVRDVDEVEVEEEEKDDGVDDYYYDYGSGGGGYEDDDGGNDMKWPAL